MKCPANRGKFRRILSPIEQQLSAKAAGSFLAFSRPLMSLPDAPLGSRESLLILYASQTGTSQEVAGDVARTLRGRRFSVRVSSIGDFAIVRLHSLIALRQAFRPIWSDMYLCLSPLNSKESAMRGWSFSSSLPVVRGSFLTHLRYLVIPCLAFYSLPSLDPTLKGILTTNAPFLFHSPLGPF